MWGYQFFGGFGVMTAASAECCSSNNRDIVSNLTGRAETASYAS
ncbi:MAG: hypothetical protein ACOX8W_10005 [bacterium]|jgi:hypothetical protein